MNGLDWSVLIGYFAVMVAIGVWSHKRVDDVSDFFTAGGKMPWWLSGISHHMSGYSAVMFTGYAGIAYTYGVTSFVTWSFPIALGVAIGSKLFAPRINRLRSRLHVASPLEYLKNRYNLPTQQALAWSGMLLKIVDVAAKWAAIATLLSVFTGITLNQGILITGVITGIYCTIGGLWADALTELGQFVIQLLAGVAMFVAVVLKLGDHGGFFGVWDEPELQGHAEPLVGPYGTVFLLAFLFIKLFEYNGGMLNQAQRYMATKNAREATRSARLSAVLWLVWPLVLFFPMWMSPLLVESQKADGSDSYALMTEQLLPHGLLGLVIVGFFSHTMAMCSSDANAIAAVFTRDVAPVLSKRARGWGQRSGLLAARLTTVIFLGLSMAVATQVDSPTFKDIITVVIKWVAGLMGPIAIPMMLGLLRPFRRSGPTAALTSWALGLVAFWLVNYPINWSVDGGVPLEYQVSVPLAVSLVLYIAVGYLRPEDTPERLAIIERVNTDGDDDATGAAAAVPTPADGADDVVGRGSSRVGD
ncbi:sodium:solute symporter family protein [Streptomyces olivaceus]|uniref:sodium:solute symporter family protein n=1 Tax=Streptomyces TaxID=1883 RepID=UPI0018A7F809|nr:MULTISPECIES: sodium:solute symporter family protein [Streptomyces]MBF8174070.1 Na+:solute symporter [Streptomyces olivaceus]MBZ6139482.1 Na+:solute symporter [Streptomyces olivaceus]MBZ6167106.1 Na+:solute symporter [Streptomyces olivaceus]MBZ6173695.1 Na+:solute symporter [Streptomyces olivaceus]MBZ6179872.1 Na+:solute symporter [Streptomyces olivaceus]